MLLMFLIVVVLRLCSSNLLFLPGLFSNYLFGVHFSPEKKDLILLVPHSCLHCRLNFLLSTLSFTCLLMQTVVKNSTQKAGALPDSGLVACVMILTREVVSQCSRPWRGCSPFLLPHGAAIPCILLGCAGDRPISDAH